MRVLYVTNGFPYPLTSGYLRHYFLIRELAADHAITLLSLTGNGFRDSDLEELEPLTERAIAFRDRARLAFVGKVERRMRSILPSVGRGAIAQLARTAAEQHARQPFDAMVFSGKSTWPVLAAVPDVPVTADLCDATSLRLRGALRHAPVVRRPLTLLDLQIVRRIERRIVQRARRLVFASARDRDAIVVGRDRDRSSVVPNGVDTAYWRRSSATLGRDAIVFTGVMNYPPNTDAAVRLITEILPRVRDRIPEASLAIVGRDPVRSIRAAARGVAGVTVTGYVDDVRPYLDRAAVFAAPLRFGAGIQNKILEAMSAEVPVVASPLAADGIRVAGLEPPLVVADGRAAVVDAIVARLAATRRDPAPDASGRRYVEQHFVWQRSGELLGAAIEAAVRDGARVGFT